MRSRYLIVTRPPKNAMLFTIAVLKVSLRMKYKMKSRRKLTPKNRKSAKFCAVLLATPEVMTRG